MDSPLYYNCTWDFHVICTASPQILTTTCYRSPATSLQPSPRSRAASSCEEKRDQWREELKEMLLQRNYAIEKANAGWRLSNRWKSPSSTILPKWRTFCNSFLEENSRILKCNWCFAIPCISTEAFRFETNVLSLSDTHSLELKGLLSSIAVKSISPDAS